MKKHLTDEAVKAAKLPSGRDRIEIYDSECKGLVLRVSANAKTWMFYLRFEGRFQKVTIGNALAIKLAKARTIARSMRDKLLQGADPRGAGGDDTPDTFKQLATLWLEKYSKVHRRSWGDDDMVLRVHALPMLGDKRLVVIDGPTIARMHATIMETERSKETERAMRLQREPKPNAGARIADRVVAVVKSIFRWGVPYGYVTGDPTVGLMKFAGKRGTGKIGRERVLSDKEIIAFLDVLPRVFTDERWQIIVRLALLLGSRKSELADLETRELHLDETEPFWLQPAERVKNKYDHVVPLPPMAVELIMRAKELNLADARLGQSKFLFPSPETGAPAAATGLHIALARAFRAGTIKVRDPVKGYMTSQKREAILVCDRFTIHDLRRTAATGMARLGIDRLVIAKCLNHRTADHATVTGLIYDRHDYAVEKRAALTRWAEHVAKLEMAASPSQPVEPRIVTPVSATP